MKLRTKLLIFAMPTYLVVVVAMTSLAQHGVRTMVEQSEYRRGLGVALGEARNPDTIDGFRTGLENQLLLHLQEVQEHTKALYAMALSPSGRVLAHTNVARVGKTYADSTTQLMLISNEPVYRQIVVEDRPVMDLSVPVVATQAAASEEFLLLGDEVSSGDTPLGVLRIALPLSDALATATRISNQVFWIITIGSTAALILGLVVIGRLLKPVQQLSTATEELGRGNLGETVPVASRDEIGDLAERFNRMSMDLALTTVSKEYNDNILQSMNDALTVVSQR